MAVETWLAFALAAFIVLIIPGPTIVLVVGRAMTYGKRSVVPLVTGVTLGDFTAMTLSLLGLGAVMAASAALFTLFKWVGAGYLLYLGIKTWRADPTATLTPAHDLAGKDWVLLRSAYIVTALNPKSIAFFVAFLPQFVDHRAATLPQFTVMTLTFLALAALNAALYALFAGQMVEHLQNVRARRWINRTGGTALIGAGLLTAAMKRA
ncbi:MAG: LysE family translocator [Caldilineaceae bacterium]|nr:LysE family translocator [Caldilineaceae bacterium]